ncbi:MAG TPA: hypothetical protein VHO70_03885 [Chitinispirillaceae bacterium]|nr:hypothetical protein [Chitinispirillaceae bacterium]
MWENDTGVDRDSSCIDEAGDSWQISEKKCIRKEGCSFRVYSYNTQSVISSLSGTTLSTSSRSRIEKLYDFIITPLDSVPSFTVPPLAGKNRSSGNLDAQIRLLGTNITVGFNVPVSGVVTVILYTIQGRLISSENFQAEKGAGQLI